MPAPISPQPSAVQIRPSTPLRAGSFIVSLFGDVIAPRGGEVGIGDIIAFCAPLDLSETLIRTAMSRLVAAGQVQGKRVGRRSYYALTPEACAEYEHAAKVIYGCRPTSKWRFVFFPDGDAPQQIADGPVTGPVALSDHFALGPVHSALPEGSLSFTASAEGPPDHLRRMVEALWDLAPLAARYREVITLAKQIEAAAPFEPATALRLRVLLLHAYRHCALRDPRLPADALPMDWPGSATRQYFAKLYLTLSATAETEISSSFSAALGPLANMTEQSRARARSLQNLLSE